MKAAVIFLIEGSSTTGSCIEQLTEDYIKKILELFQQRAQATGNDPTAVQFAVVFYQGKAGACHPKESFTYTFGPYISSVWVLEAIRAFNFDANSGGYANLAEGIAAVHCCLQKMINNQDECLQRHCILVTGREPQNNRVEVCELYKGKTALQLTKMFARLKVSFSVISPRRMPELFRLFLEAAHKRTFTATNFGKTPDEFVLLNGISLNAIDHRAEPAEHGASPAPI